jgi:ferric-dicitrate binding protein FerR (iron transport regulator)
MMNDDLIERYLAGDASGAERAAVEQWLAAQPERAELFAQLRGERGNEAAFDTDAAWHRLSAQLTDTSLGASLRWRAAAAAAGSGKPWHRRGIVRTAAIIAVTAFSTFVWRASVQRPAAESVASRDISTRAGQRATFQLPDGTRVTLAPA